MCSLSISSSVPNPAPVNCFVTWHGKIRVHGTCTSSLEQGLGKTKAAEDYALTVKELETLRIILQSYSKSPADG